MPNSLQKILLTFNILFILNVFAYSQTLFELFSKEEMLSQSTARCISQDKQGYLWVGTWDGLNRFSGINFEVFRNAPSDRKSIAKNQIVSIKVDSFDRIWILFSNGTLDVYNKTYREFYHIHNSETEEILVSDNLSLNQDNSGDFWVISNGVLTKIDYRTMKTYSFRNIQNFSNTSSLSNMQIINFTESTLYLLHNEQTVLSRKLKFNVICFSYFDGNRYFLGTDKGEIHLIDLDNGTIRFLGEVGKQRNGIDNTIHFIHLDKSGTLWIGTNSGLFRKIDFLTKTLNQEDFERIQISLTNGVVKENTTFYAMEEDYRGTLWFAGYDGVYRYDPLLTQFKAIPKGKTYKQVFGESFILALLPLNEQELLIGTNSFLMKYNKLNNSSTVYTTNNSTISNNTITCMISDKKGHVWVGTKYGLNKFDVLNRRFEKVEFRNKNYEPRFLNTILAIEEGDNEVLWLGTVVGVIKYSKKSGEYTVYEYPFQNNPEGKSYILSLLYDNDVLWAGTNGSGLLKIELNDMSYERFTTSNSKLLSDKIMALHKDSQNNLWIATMGGGISKRKSDDLEFKTFSTQNGLANNTVYGILEADDTNLWFSTNNGLTRINGRTDEITNYSSKYGLASQEFNQNSYVRSKDGIFYFGGIKGIVHFDPNSIRNENPKLKVALTSFSLLNKRRDDLLRDSLLVLSHNDFYFTFDISVLLIDEKENFSVSYLLEGLNDEWINIGKKTSIDLSFIPHGSFVLKVKVANESGVWSDEITLAKIQINPPWWQTIWFYLSILIISGLLFFLAIRYLLRKKYKLQLEHLERDNLLLEERMKTRERIARDLHDDLSSTISSAGMFIFTAQRVIDEDSNRARLYLEKSSEILNNAERAMNDIVWSVSPSYDTIDNLILRIKLTAQDLCEGSSIALDIQTNGELNGSLDQDIRRNIYLAVKEVLSNSVRHSNATQIMIKATLEEKKLRIEVEDNGSGFNSKKTEKKLGGNGLRNLEQRCLEIQAELTVLSEIGKGTLVRIVKELLPNE